MTVTDLPSGAAEADHWMGAAQWAADLDATRDEKLCSPEEFAANAEFRPVDMRSIPSDLRGFDFSWSSCAFEHLGTLRRGAEFIHRQMEVLRPGGVAVYDRAQRVQLGDDRRSETYHRRRDLGGCSTTWEGAR